MDEDISMFERSGADIVLTKPMRANILQRLFEYCKLYGTKQINSKGSR